MQRLEKHLILALDVDGAFREVTLALFHGLLAFQVGLDAAFGVRNSPVDNLAYGIGYDRNHPPWESKAL